MSSTTDIPAVLSSAEAEDAPMAFVEKRKPGFAPLA